MDEETLKQRIQRERRELELKPWQFAPSEVDDGPPPHSPGSAGYFSWLEAQQLRRQIRERDRDYFTRGLPPKKPRA